MKSRGCIEYVIELVGRSILLPSLLKIKPFRFDAKVRGVNVVKSVSVDELNCANEIMFVSPYIFSVVVEFSGSFRYVEVTVSTLSRSCFASILVTRPTYGCRKPYDDCCFLQN